MHVPNPDGFTRATLLNKPRLYKILCRVRFTHQSALFCHNGAYNAPYISNLENHIQKAKQN